MSVISLSQEVTNAALCAVNGVPDGFINGFLREDAEAALEAAFPIMLRDFLYSDGARDVTGKWGFTTTAGDAFREELLAVVAASRERAS